MTTIQNFFKLETKKPKVLVAHLGARKHYQEPIIFHEWGILDKFYTDLYSGNSWITQLLRHPKIYSYLPNVLKKGLDRYDPTLDKAKIIHFPWFGYQFFKACRKALLGQTSGIFTWAGKEFCQRIIQDGLGQANVVYGFNWESLELFEYAKTRGIHCILDQTIAARSLVHQLLLAEEQHWSGWSLSSFTVNNADLELLEREQREQDLADHIICGSKFVKDSLIARGIKAEKISVVSLGRLKTGQMSKVNSNRKTLRKQRDTLRILFAGTVSLRKGIPYLLEALRQLKGQIPFTCKVAGSIEIKHERITEYSDVCNFLGRVPRSEMAELYDWADVFVLPSICEGSAMVTYEALAHGLPIITTYNSGSLVRDGIDGYIVPIRDSEAIANKLFTLFETNCSLNINKDIENYFEQIYHQSLETFFQSLQILAK
jgi:glycosyltransferase involved in cell wall biosynthesis